MAGGGLVANGGWTDAGGCPFYVSVFQIFSYLIG
jgi:hypothetical protein